MILNPWMIEEEEDFRGRVKRYFRRREMCCRQTNHGAVKIWNNHQSWRSHELHLLAQFPCPFLFPMLRRRQAKKKLSALLCLITSALESCEQAFSCSRILLAVATRGWCKQQEGQGQGQGSRPEQNSELLPNEKELKERKEDCQVLGRALYGVNWQGLSKRHSNSNNRNADTTASLCNRSQVLFSVFKLLPVPQTLETRA